MEKFFSMKANDFSFDYLVSYLQKFLNASLLNNEISKIPGECRAGNLTASVPPIAGEKAGK